jgi:hypothetical protein
MRSATVFATYRLDHTATDRVARTLSAWSVTSNATIAAMTALWRIWPGATRELSPGSMG